MATNGTSPSGGGGGAGGKMTLDQIIFKGLSSNPAKITSWSVLGTALTGLAVGKVLLDTGKYFDFFHHRDNKWIQIGVVTGTLACCAHFGITVAQSWELAQHAFTDFYNINRFDSICNSTSDLIGVFTNVAASTYFAWRAYKMSGRKWWLLAIMLTFTFTTFCMGMYVNIRGFTAPDVTFETATKAREFSAMMRPVRKAWGAMSMASDGMVTLAMMFFLTRSRNSIFHREKRIYHKLNVLILETMLPPACLVLILDVVGKGSPTGDFRRPVRMLLPVMFYLSLLHSLVARATIRQMLGGSLASTGMLGPDNTTNAGESVFVATYHADDEKLGTDTKERDIESGGQHVLPSDSFPRAGSPISNSSSKPK